MVNIVVRDRKTKFSKLNPCIFSLLSILSSRGVFFSSCTDRNCDRSLIFIFTVLTQNVCLNNYGHSLKF